MRVASARCLIIALIAIARPCVGVKLTGAGSTFVYPLVAKWATAYAAETGDQVNYQSIGSGGGIKQIENKTVDFGATDMPLDASGLEHRGLTQFPLIAGAIVPVVRLNGVADGSLKLSGPVLAQIYLGKIKRWNESALTTLNPGVTLPDRLITVVHRADGSGTSFIWTSYLSSVSAEWRQRIGAASALTWPTGVGGKGNEGVAAFVKQTEGAIGYVESAFALRAHLTTTQLQNRDGQFVSAQQPNFRAAVEMIDWAKSSDDVSNTINPSGPRSWPIAAATFVLMRREPTDPATSRAALKFFAWAFEHGGPSAEALHYVPLPQTLQRRVARDWPSRIRL